MMHKKSACAYFLIMSVICVCLLVFFIQIHPLQVFDTDDWTYISYSRNIFPDLREWNPARIFPEIFMPLCGAVGAYLIRPLTGDYLYAMTIVSGLAVVGFILAYLHAFGKTMRTVFRLEHGLTAAMMPLFLLFHFWIFRSRPDDNAHLFYTPDMTCVYYYVIPTLLNAVVVLMMEARPRLWQESGPIKRGVLLLAVYLAIFSNLFSSVVLAVYCGVRLLFGFLERTRGGIRQAFGGLARGENALMLCVVAAWLVSLCLEVLGGRAQQVGQQTSTAQFATVLRTLYVLLAHANRYFLAFCVGVGGLALWLLIRVGVKEEAERQLLRKGLLYGLCGGLTLLYLILLCAVGDLTGYIGRGDVALAYCFYFLLALCAAVGYVLRRRPSWQVVLPLLTCLVLLNTNTQASTFAEPNVLQLPPESVSRYSGDVLRQVLEADDLGQTVLELRIPQFNNSSNWPHTFYMGGRLPTTLLEHGMITVPMEISVVPDPELNEHYGFPH